MTRARAVALWGAAAAGPAGATWIGAGAVPSALGLGLLFALAVACAPAPEGTERPALPWPVAWCWALPPLALAWALDRTRGADPGALDPVAATGLVLLAGWCWLGGRGSSGPLRAACWLVLFGGPCLALALEWAGAGAGASTRSWPAELAAISPLGWAYLSLLALARGTPTPGPEVLIAVAALLIASRVPGGSGRRAALSGILLVVVLTPRATAGEERLLPARLELIGPLSGAVVEVSGGGRATLQLELAPGERRTLVVGLPVPSRLARDLATPPRPEPIAAASLPGGQARFVEWVDDAAARARWGALPAGLKARSRPLPKAARAQPTVGGLLLAAALLVISIRAGRRRAWWSVPPSLALAGLFAGGFGIRPPEALPVELWDVDLAGGTGTEDGQVRVAALRVRVGAGALELPPGEWRVETAPEGVPLEVLVRFPKGAAPTTDLRARGALLQCLAPVPLELAPGTGGDALDAAVAALEGRGVGGGGVARRDDQGGWPGGRAEGSDVAGLPAWPSWCISGLPFGRRAALLRPAGPGVWGRVVH